MCRIFVLVLFFIFISIGYADETAVSDEKQLQDSTDGIQMSIREGQFVSDPFEIFINQNIDKSLNPRLMLINVSGLIPKRISKDPELRPQVIARNQTKIINNISYKGTLLLFNLHQYQFHYYEILKQVKPVLIWDNPDDPEQPYNAIGIATNIGNTIPFILFILFIVGLCVAMIIFLSKRAKKRAIELLLGDDGHLSLSLTQVSAWTIVVGGVVFGFGLLMLKVPEIPNSLLVLMGLSLATGGIKHYVGASKSKTKLPDIKNDFNLSDLISEYDPNTDTRKTSLPKAQMLFWTVLMLYLFIVKSIADATLWAVPWEMVTLMGMSQGAYLSPHIVNTQKSDESADSTDTANAGDQK